jgi:hypothetical protein
MKPINECELIQAGALPVPSCSHILERVREICHSWHSWLCRCWSWPVNLNDFKNSYFIASTAALRQDIPGASCKGIPSVEPIQEERNNVEEKELTRNDSTLTI